MGVLGLIVVVLGLVLALRLPADDKDDYLPQRCIDRLWTVLEEGDLT